jgi:hypothetical protein
MLKLLEDENEITEAQGHLERRIQEDATSSKRIFIGFPSGKMEADTYWIEHLDLWCAFEHAGNRYWNALGLGNPFEVTTPPPGVEINPPISGIDRRIAGGFVADEAGRLYLIHRGKVGGGRKGVGKNAFLRWYTGESESKAGDQSLYGGELIEISDGDQVTPVIVIGALDEPRFLDRLTEFVRCSSEFRELASRNQLRPKRTAPSAEAGPADDLNELLSEEYAGTKQYTRNQDVIAQCDHGLVVNQLLRLLREDGHDARRDLLRDGFILKGSKVTHLFEVKTATNTTSLYAAVGQLFWHGGGNRADRLISVLPKGFDDKVAQRLKALSIRVVTYDWDSDNKPTFHGLKEALS